MPGIITEIDLNTRPYRSVIASANFKLSRYLTKRFIDIMSGIS